MKVRGTNTQVNPVYWAHQCKWPYGVTVEHDVPEELYKDILADSRIAVELGKAHAEPAPQPFAMEATPVEKSRGRKRGGE
jgi:hypothetical protein